MNKPTPGGWCYLRSESNLWTVGFYAPDGKWQPDSDYNNREEAARRVAWLNGGAVAEALPGLVEALKELSGVEYRHGSPAKHASEFQLAQNKARAVLAKLEVK